MNYELMFQLAMALRSKRGNNTNNTELFKVGKKEVKLNRYQQEDALNKSIQAFMHAPGQVVAKDKAIQAFAGSSDLPILTKDVFNVTNEVPNWDLLWQNSFKGIKLTQGELSWEICTVDTGITFKLIPEGGKIEYADLKGEKAIVDVEKYGAGLGITWETINARKLYKFVQQMESARAALYTLWGGIHYGLLATAGATNPIAWQGAATNATLNRDIETLNKGASDLGEDNKDSGYGDTANVRLLCYASPKLRPRLNQALRVTSAERAVAGGGNTDLALGQVVDANIDPLYTYTSEITANKALLVLPGHKIQNAVYLNELGLPREEIESLNQLRTYWTAFGAVIGDADQVYELSFS